MSIMATWQHYPIQNQLLESRDEYNQQVQYKKQTDLFR